MSIYSRLLSRTLILGLLFGTWARTAHAATPNRISIVSDSGTRLAVDKTVPARARLSKDLGEAPGAQVISSVGIHFNLTDAQQADLNQLLAAQQNPASPLYHQWLTPQQYGVRFGLSTTDMDKVKGWLKGKGLSVTAVSPSMNYITVSGTITQIDAALGVSIHNVSEDGVSHITNLSDPTLPAAIANVVTGITGLNDFKPRARARVSVVRASAISPRFTSSISGNHYMAPGDFYNIYDSLPLIQNSFTGTGITIAVVGQTDISLTDVAAFRSASGLPTNAPTIVQAPGYKAGILSADIDEAQLDVEWSGASAPGATIKYVTVGASTTASVMDSLVYAITAKLAPIITISYGACESNWGQSNLSLYNQYFQQANAQGTTIVGPSGDSGATDCDYQESTATQGLAVDFPASSPYVTAVGGTMLNEGSGTYWNSTNDSFSGSAKGYIPETVWNESDATGLSAGGGGISSYFGKPAWQVGSGVPNDLSRDIPDISLNAASVHDGYLFCSQGSCTNGYRNASNNLNVVGGTSVASPTFAGILALLEQQLGSTSGLGNVNPMIYGLANSTYYGSVFHDVTGGNNNSPCAIGTKDCPSGGSIGYSANTSYDRATGWGSVDVYNFVTKWNLVSPTGTGSTAVGTSLSTTTITSSAASCGVSSGTTPLTVRVSGSGGTPSGTVQILVDNAALTDSASTLTLDANGSATYQLNASALSGGHTVSAVYSGNSVFAASKGTATADFVYASQKDFAITPCTSSLSVKAGGAGTATFTLTPFNGFTGSVTFAAVSEGSLTSTYTFTPSPVTISSTGATTFTLKVAGYQSSAVRSGDSQTLVASQRGSGHMPWYGAGSGAALACTLLLGVPRRRRWGALLAAVISVASFTAVGCGAGGSGTLGSSSGSGSTTTTTNATVGTYTVVVTATSGGLVHSSTLNLTITQ